jgi:glutamate-1-semialdehyde 2,1-aminomutase
MKDKHFISKLEEIEKTEEKIYEEKTAKSRELWERAKKVFPGGVTYAIRFFKPYPVYISRAKGTRIWDVDGNEYIDFWEGHGTHLLGHLPDVVVNAVSEAIKERGTHLGFENPYAVEYAEFLIKMLPNIGMIRFSNSATEANMYATRLARTYTKRKYIVKMEGGWHGGVDSLHKATSSPPFDRPESAGIPEEFLKYTIAVPYNDVDSLEEVLRKEETAAVLIEPVLGGGGCIGPEGNYLKEVRKLTEEYGALLIFDETITGFRLMPGGAQEFFGVKSDLTVYGKAIGGGVPGAGAIGGKSEIMEMMDHLKYPEREKRSFHGGTFVGNPIVMSAGKALVEYLYQHRELYEKANSMWEELRRRAEKLCNAYEVDCYATGAGTMTGIHFTTRRPKNSREVYELKWSGGKAERTFNLISRNRGILFLGENEAHLLPALVHEKDELNLLLNSLELMLTKIRS